MLYPTARTRCTALMLMVLFFCTCAGAEAAQADALPSAQARRFDTPPTIDGLLSESVWADAGKLRLSRILFTDDEPPVATEVYLGFDDTWIYFGFECEGQPGAAIPAVQKGRNNDKVGQDDCVEIFLDTIPGKWRYLHFLLSAGNAKREQLVTGPLGEQRDASWNVGWRSATTVQPDRWTAEIAMPVHVLALSRERGEVPLNITRTVRALTEGGRMWVTWAPVGSRQAGVGFHDPDHFGTLKGLDMLQDVSPAFDPMLVSAGKVRPYVRVEDGYTYGIDIMLSNHGGRGGTATVVVEDTTAAGATIRHEERVDLPPRGSLSHTLTVPVPAPADRQARVALSHQLDWDNPWTDVKGTEVLVTLTAYPNLSCYTGEPEGRLIVGCAYEDEAFRRNRFSLEVIFIDSKEQTVLEKRFRRIRNQGIVIPLPVATWEPDTYTVRVRLLDRQGEPVARTAARVLIAPPPPDDITITKVDHERMCMLLNGEPYFPYAWLAPEPFREEYETAREQAEAGFGCTVEWLNIGGPRQPGMSPEDYLKTRNESWLEKLNNMRQEGMERAFEQHGLYSIMAGAPRIYAPSYITWNKPLNDLMHEETLKRFPGMVEQFGRHPALIGWGGYDELHMKVLPYALSQGARLRNLDPYHIQWSTCRGIHPRFYDAYDIFGVHVYWAPSKGPNMIAAAIQEGYKTAKMARAPVFATPQGQRLTYERELTPDERRAGLYLPIIQGAKGITFFVLPYRGTNGMNEHIWRVLSYTGREIQILAPVLLQQRPPQNIVFTFSDSDEALLPPLPRQRTLFDPSSPGGSGREPEILKGMPVIQALVHDKPRRESRGELLLIANSGNKPLEVHGVLSSRPESIREYFSGRKVQVKNGHFTLQFRPYGVFVLETFGSSRQPGDPVSFGMTAAGPLEEEPSTPQNLVENGDFESDIPWEPGRKWGAPYVTYGNWGLSGKAELVTNDAYQGTTALRLTGQPDGNTCTRHLVKLKPYTNYRISLWAKLSLESYRHHPTFFFMRYVPRDSNKERRTRHFQPRNPEIPETEWKQYGATFTTGEETNDTWNVYLLLSPGTEGQVLVDDVRVEDLTHAAQSAHDDLARNLAKAAGAKHDAAVYDTFDTLAQFGVEPPARPGENLLKNSSLEQAVYPGIPDRWAKPGRYNAMFRQTDAKAFHGKRCVEIMPMRTWDHNLDYLLWTNWEPNRDFTFSFYAKAEKPGTFLRTFVRQYTDSSRIEDKTRYQDISVGTEWERYTWTFRIPSEGANRWSGAASVGFYNYPQTLEPAPEVIGTVWVDAMQLELGSRATAYKPDTYRSPPVNPKWYSDEVFKELERRKHHDSPR